MIDGLRFTGTELSCDRMVELLHEHKTAIWWVASISSLVFVASLVIVPWLVIRIPEDYFVSPRRPRLAFSDEHPVVRWSVLIIKNLLGAVLVLAGIAMLVLPGQGLLTVAIGVLMLDFPGKHRLERKIIRYPAVFRSINWLRRKAKVEPLRTEISPLADIKRPLPPKSA